MNQIIINLSDKIAQTLTLAACLKSEMLTLVLAQPEVIKLKQDLESLIGLENFEFSFSPYSASMDLTFKGDLSFAPSEVHPEVKKHLTRKLSDFITIESFYSMDDKEYFEVTTYKNFKKDSGEEFTDKEEMNRSLANRIVPLFEKVSDYGHHHISLYKL